MDIKTIIFGGLVGNSYLITTDAGFILIDTGRASTRNKLEKELDNAGCKPGNLDLIILTHGDFDHTGNCVYIHNKFNTKIAMHYDDFGMVERGDMFWNRKTGNFFAKKIVNFLFRISNFTPDFAIDEGYDFSEYGFDAKVINLPGHSKGSIGVLTANGDLFCGDLLMNTDKPDLSSIIDDITEANRSVLKLKSLNINTVYPGHGKPFPMSAFTK